MGMTEEDETDRIEALTRYWASLLAKALPRDLAFTLIVVERDSGSSGMATSAKPQLTLQVLKEMVEVMKDDVHDSEVVQRVKADTARFGSN